jgi:ELWxxDGT repeat protein
VAFDAQHGRELWESDGTTTGTVLVKDILNGPRGSDPRSLAEVNGALYFLADDEDAGDELWISARLARYVDQCAAMLSFLTQHRTAVASQN